MTHRKASEFLRSHVLGLVAIFIALTGTAVNAGAAEDTATSAAVSNAKFKKLKQRVAAVETTLNGSATGDLQGKYPNLQLRANAVGSADIANDAVTRAKIANDAVDSTKLANDAVTEGKIAVNAVTDTKLAASSVGSSELKTVAVEAGTTTAVPNNTASGALSANCNAGEQALSGGGFWSDLTATGDGLAIAASTNGFGGASTWLVAGSNQSGASQNYFPQVVCLDP